MSYTINPNAKNKWVRNADNTMDLSIETDASSVYLDNGRTLEQEIGEGSMVSNVTTVDSSMSKVIDGTLDGAYESCKMYGKSLVNLMTNCKDEYVVRYHDPSNPNHTVANISMMKPNTEYTLFYKAKYRTEGDGSGTSGVLKIATSIEQGFNIYTAQSFTTEYKQYVYSFTTSSVVDCFVFSSTDKYFAIKECVLLEGDYTQEDIPYFKGLCDAKMPILQNVGKNLFDVNMTNFTNVTAIPIDGSLIIKKNTNPHYYSRTPIHLKPNTKYTFKCNTYRESDTETYVKLHLGARPHNDSLEYGGYVVPVGDGTFSKTFTTNSLGELYINGYTTTKGILLSNIQLEESSTATTYEDYKTNILETSNDIVLRGLPKARLGEYNACDNYDCLTGEHTQHIGEIVFDGSDDESWTWREERDGITGFTINMPNDMFHSGLVNVTEGFISNVASAYRKDYSICMGYGGTRTICLWTSTSTISQVSELKTKLSQNPITIQYKLAEPIVTTIEPSTTPFAYENGHIILESGHEGQSLLPTLEYSTVINRTGQIQSIANTIQKQEKQITKLEQMLIQNIINLNYNNTLLALKNEMEEML